MPKFKYFLSNRNNPVREGDFVWSTPIPLSRHQSSGTIKSDSDIFINHGDYFTAAQDFLERDRCAIITQSVSQYLHRHIISEEIEEIRIFLDKHGEFYHPAKIETVLQADKIPFVLNVAVTNVGKQCTQREYRLLKKLDTEYPDLFIPKVYAQGNVFTKMDQVETRMFLGEWFEGFNEFHMSLDPDDKKYKIIVWDNEHGNFFLTTHQTMELYRQAAKILTCYYNFETFEQIFSWHHAAGDFVLKCQQDDIELKLVTVRQYRSMYKNNIASESIEPDSELIIEALLVFFLNMAIKMRIDRLDGVGEIVWSDDIALKGILKGFFDGLALKPLISVFPEPLDHCFRQHLLSIRQADFFDLNHAIVHTYPSQAPELPVIRQHLGKHVEDLYNNIRQLEKM
ncbi:MAG: hypothetical protein BMS9Abin03_390 [Thermodesulfobacteriota bacterium]|nr:MAG: hypothetical protein BMS9Abin03_390 [Thermodesulfobacteriota bacterium]